MPSAQSVPTFVLPRERALAKLRAGWPLLHDEAVVLDVATDRFVQLVTEQAMQLPRLDLSALLTEAFVQHADHLEQLGGGQRLVAVAEEAVRPLRRAYADRLRGFVHDWARGYCPICGASPGQTGPVVCAACGCEWHAAAVEPAFRLELALPDEDA
jgi:hypothetical protein